MQKKEMQVKQRNGRINFSKACVWKTLFITTMKMQFQSSQINLRTPAENLHYSKAPPTEDQSSHDPFVN